MRGAVAAAGVCLLLGGCVTLPRVDAGDLANSKPSDRVIPYELTDTVVLVGAVEKSVSGGGGGGGAGGGGAGGGGGGAGEKGSGASSGGTTTGGANIPSGVLQPTRWDVRPVSLLKTEFADCGGGACEGAITAVGLPTSFRDRIYSVTGRTQFFVHTILTPIYQEKSLRLKSLSVDTLDQRKEAIDTLGALVGGVAKVSTPTPAKHGAGGGGAAPTPKLTLPVAITLADLKAQMASGDHAHVPLAEPNKGWFYSSEWIGHDNDPASLGFHRRSDMDKFHGSVVTSMCRHLKVTLDDNATKITMEVVVADPDFIQPVPLPAKGVVAFNDLCGADVTGTGALPTSSAAMVTDFMTQVLSRK